MSKKKQSIRAKQRPGNKILNTNDTRYKDKDKSNQH